MARTSPRAAVRVALSIVVLLALFAVAWLVFMPVGALLVAPITLALSFGVGAAPSPALNTLGAIGLSGGMAAATVAAVLRVLLRRSRRRQRAAGSP